MAGPRIALLSSFPWGNNRIGKPFRLDKARSPMIREDVHRRRTRGYRHHMRDCIQAAVCSNDERARAAFLNTAFCWGRLAKQWEQLELSGARPSGLDGVEVILFMRQPTDD